LTAAREPKATHEIQLPARALDRARARGRRQRWLNLALLGIVVPTVLAA
jgi:hypothetical protein